MRPSARPSRPSRTYAIGARRRSSRCRRADREHPRGGDRADQLLRRPAASRSPSFHRGSTCTRSIRATSRNREPSSGVPLRAQVILFVGRVQPLKAPDVLIKAVAELVRVEPARRERLQLIIIGSPSGPDVGLGADPTRAGGFRARASPISLTSGRTRRARSCSAGTARRTWSACRRTTSRSGSLRSRRRPARDPWSPPTSAACGMPWTTEQTGCLVSGHGPGTGPRPAGSAGRPG